MHHIQISNKSAYHVLPSCHSPAYQAAAAQVAQSLGYNVAPVGVPTAAAYGDLLGWGVSGWLVNTGVFMDSS